MTTRTNIKRIGTGIILVLLAVIFQGSCERQVSSVKNRLAEEILDESGIKGGFIVHIRCGDGRLTAALCANDSYLVHGLDANAKNIFFLFSPSSASLLMTYADKIAVGGRTGRKYLISSTGT